MLKIRLILLALAAGFDAWAIPVGGGLADANEATVVCNAASDDEKAVRAVFADILERTYRYDHGSRENASAAYRELRLYSLTPMVRDIAAMEASSGNDHERRLDLMSIRKALFDLTLLRDPDAVRLNRARVDDPDLRSAAMRNLADLQDWAAVSAVLRVLERTATDFESLPEITAGVLYISRLPTVDHDVCQQVGRFRPLFRACEESGARLTPYCTEFMGVYRRATSACRRYEP